MRYKLVTEEEYVQLTGKNFEGKAFTNNDKDDRINYSKETDLFRIDGEATNITPMQIINDLNTSDVGRDIMSIINTLPQTPILDYTTAPSGIYAEERFGVINVYIKNCKDTKTATCKLIHEMTHYRYGIGESQWAECVCVAQELKHRYNRDYLTFSERKRIVKAVKNAYPEFNWRKGGRINGRRQK